MNKIPTAEEQLEIYGTSHAIEAMKEFAKLHVEAALKAASENADLIETDGDIDPNTIINAYPLSKIK